MSKISKAHRYWFVSGCLACLLALAFLDGPVARHFEASFLHKNQSSFAVGAYDLLLPLLLMAACCIAWIVLQRKLTRITEAFLLGGFSSVMGFSINALILKPFFGRQNVDIFLYYNDRAGFFPFEGSARASFPSGHMVIASALATVAWCYFPRFIAVYVVAAVALAAVLVVGEWHFVSDTIAGTMWGCGIAIGAIGLWRRFIPSSALNGSPQRE